MRNDIESEKRFSEEIMEMLKPSGWFSGRDVRDLIKLPDDFEVFSAALEVLKEFGLLRFGKRGAGIECARSVINCDPMLAVGESDRFSEYSEWLQSQLYPLGEVDDGHYFLVIDEMGRTFLLMNDLKLVHITFDGAIENLLKGINSLSWYQ